MSPEDFDYMRKFLRERSGLTLSTEKQYLLDTRLAPLIRARGFETMGHLIRAVRADPQSDLATLVTEAMTTNESLFFRDKVPFENFRNVIMPALRGARAAAKRLRIWCAACSAGQEPYSLAIAIKEHRLLPEGWSVEIVATDLSSAMLERAKEGVYTQFEVQRGLPIQLLVKYFTQHGDAWQILPELRAMVKFSRINLLENLARLGRFDVIFCRNVLIYFDQPTKIDVLERLSRQIAPDGYLLLGAAETVIGLTDKFAPLADQRGLYVPAQPGPSPALRSAPASMASPPLAPTAARPFKTVTTV
ncbi:MAG: protein-glutamate O-methyltransferase CheR [Pseudolabrys sp.]